MSSASINDLPDSSFAYIEPGGTKDDGGKTTPRELRHFPIHDAAHVRNALARLSQSPFGPKAAAKVHAAAKKFGIEVAGAQRAELIAALINGGLSPEDAIAELAVRAEGIEWPLSITRAFPLEDIDVRSGKVTCDRCGRDATGRMVDAYAAVFGVQTEVHDQYGHYVEDIDRAAFNKAIADWSRSKGIGNVAVFYNHGKTLYDTPSERGSVPLGHPSAIRADMNGVLTATHYDRDEFSDSILQKIIDGSISGHSFTGRIYRSDPERVPRLNRDGSLPNVRRLEMGLKEYGPTPVPYYEAAGVLAVRSIPATGVHTGDGAAPPAPPHPTGVAPEEPSQTLRSADIHRRIDAFNASIGGKLPRSGSGPATGDPGSAGGRSE